MATVERKIIGHGKRSYRKVLSIQHLMVYQRRQKKNYNDAQEFVEVC